jgi:hypothetical protein
VTLIQSNDMIQELTAMLSYPTLGSSILPGRLRAGSFGRQSGLPQERDHGIIELRFSI